MLTRRINSTATDIGMYAYVSNIGCHRVQSLYGTLELILAWARIERERCMKRRQQSVRA